MADHKTMRGVRVKDADKGTVEAVFATMNVRDHDGDVILSGAFLDGQKVRISAYNHASWGPGSLPVGKGTIRERDGEAILDGQFFLDTTAGRETFTTVKELDDLGEWSFGFDLLPGSTRQGEHEGEQVRFIGPRPDGAHGIDTHEVSPVLLGAGINTRTLAAKGKQLQSDLFRELADAARDRFSADFVFVEDIELDEEWAVFAVDSGDNFSFWQVPFSRGGAGVVLGDQAVEVEVVTEFQPKGGRWRPTKNDKTPDAPKRLTDHLATVLTAVKAIHIRLDEVTTLRAEQGKSLGQESHDAATTLADELESATKALREVLTSADGTGVDLDADVQLELERARFRL